MQFVLPLGLAGEIFGIGVFLVILLLAGGVAMFIKLYQKVDQGTALVKNGFGGASVSFTGMMVIPILHRSERMDISVKRIEIYRHGDTGLICMDNIRADIKVVFFVRVNKTPQDVMRVAQLLGCKRASDERELVKLFDAKFSEALKTVGKQFEFVELYNSRDRFKDEILKTIGTDLNGYVLDDAAIDYLEQTPIDVLNKDNILDAEGIKKITDLTAQQQVLANNIRRDREMTITKQDVEAKEAILQLERQQAEAEEKQKREIAEVTSRQQAEAAIVKQQERLRAEQARIAAEEEIQVAEENKLRQVIVAQKAKERTTAVETERVERDRALEATERERLVTLAEIDKEKSVEVERKAIQDVIRERVAVERTVVDEEEKIKDAREFATAERAKQVAVTAAEQMAEQELVKEIKAAEAAKQAAEHEAEQVVITAEARRKAAEKEVEAKKLAAEGITATEAAPGLAEAQIIAATAEAKEKEGVVEAIVLQRKAEAEARGLAAKAEAIEKEGTAEARVLELKFKADADGIREKAEAMKQLDMVGREHEEFKLQLEKEKAIELKEIDAQMEIAIRQAEVLSAALKKARIDIVGGDTNFFDKIVGSIANGKSVDRLMEHSETLQDVKQRLLGGSNGSAKAIEAGSNGHSSNGAGNPFAGVANTLGESLGLSGSGGLFEKMFEFAARFGIGEREIKTMSVAALLSRLMAQSDDRGEHAELQKLLNAAKQFGVEEQSALTALESFAGDFEATDEVANEEASDDQVEAAEVA